MLRKTNNEWFVFDHGVGELLGHREWPSEIDASVFEVAPIIVPKDTDLSGMKIEGGELVPITQEDKDISLVNRAAAIERGADAEAKHRRLEAFNNLDALIAQHYRLVRVAKPTPYTIEQLDSYGEALAEMPTLAGYPMDFVFPAL